MSDQSSVIPEGGLWAILELMGHRRIAGFVQQVEVFGAAMCRIDIPAADGKMTTQLYGGSSIYCLTPTTEEIARRLAAQNQPRPVSPYELLPPPRTERDEDDCYSQ